MMTNLPDAVEKALDLTKKELKNVLGLGDIHINLKIHKLPKGVAGRAWYNSYYKVGTVEISVEYLDAYPDTILAETVPHEVCHVYQAKYFPRAKQTHGPEFRGLMAAIGCDGKTYHSMYLAGHERKRKTVKRYIYKTVGTGKEVLVTATRHNRMQRGVVYTTTRGENLIWTGKVKKVA